ncbi:MAG: hypothetical protein M9941_10685 [Anaerolineae bacterium]|nr:hypothetical protein [Anaerolineae bacterium]MCO5198194.1 hypothetical protein [Anaerolineae bacterium]
MSAELQPENSDLEKLAVVTEEPFRSRVPLVAWFRTKWLNVAARWYIGPMQHQQNLFNEQLVRQLREYETRLIDLDRERVASTRTIAELKVRLQQTQRRADSLAQRVTELESAESDQEVS